jgi:hypothetical protein
VEKHNGGRLIVLGDGIDATADFVIHMEKKIAVWCVAENTEELLPRMSSSGDQP